MKTSFFSHDLSANNGIAVSLLTANHKEHTANDIGDDGDFSPVDVSKFRKKHEEK